MADYKKFKPISLEADEIMVEGYGDKPLKIIAENYDGKPDLVLVERRRDDFMIVKLSVEEAPKMQERIDLMPPQVQSAKSLEKHIKHAQSVLIYLQKKELAEKQLEK